MKLKLLKRIIFLSSFLGIFVLVYQQCDKKGFQKVIQFFKILVIAIGIRSGFIPISAKAFENDLNDLKTKNNATLTEILLPRSSFNLETDDLSDQAMQGSENPSLRNLLQISGGDLGKPSSPGARAQTQARNARKGFAEAWLECPSRRSRPAAASRLAQQLKTGQAAGGSGRSGNGLFGRFSPRSTPDPSNPGCAGGPRSITVISSQKNPSSLEEQNSRIIKAHDGFKAIMTDRSARHLTSNHGHTFGIEDPLPHQPTRNTTNYTQTRTRLNKVNIERFVDTVDEILKDPISEIFRNIKIRGLQGRGYYTPNYGEHGAFIGIVTEGNLAGQIIKAQPVSLGQLEILRDSNMID